MKINKELSTKRRKILRNNWVSLKLTVKKWSTTSRDKYNAYKVKTNNSGSIMEFLKKTINNWRDSFKIDKNQQERNSQSLRFGKMSITTWFISWLSTKIRKSLRQHFYNASKCLWCHAILTSNNSTTKTKFYLSYYKNTRKTSLPLKTLDKISPNCYHLMWFANKTDIITWFYKSYLSGEQLAAKNFNNWIMIFQPFRKNWHLEMIQSSIININIFANNMEVTNHYFSIVTFSISAMSLSIPSAYSSFFVSSFSGSQMFISSIKPTNSISSISFSSCSLLMCLRRS